MKNRGERTFIELPRFGARLYDLLTDARPNRMQMREIARDLTSRLKEGRLLDAGTGPGRQLREIHRLNPAIELYGLDISRAMIDRARQNLSDIPVNLRQGSIEETEYETGFFDMVTCTGTFYLWQHPETGLNEVHRILKPGGAAVLFESYRDYDRAGLDEGLNQNFADLGLLRRLLAPMFLRKQLRMTCAFDEFARIIDRTAFAGHYTVEKITLGRLPVWARLVLEKHH